MASETVQINNYHAYFASCEVTSSNADRFVEILTKYVEQGEGKDCGDLPFECVLSLVKAFISNEASEGGLLILEALTFRNSLNRDCVDLILKWYIQNHRNYPSLSSQLLLWFSHMVTARAIPKAYFSPYYSFVWFSLLTSTNVSAVCHFLITMACHKTATSYLAFLTEKLIKNSTKRNKHLSALLGILSQYHPHLSSRTVAVTCTLPKLSPSLQRAIQLLLDSREDESDPDRESTIRRFQKGVPQPYYSEVPNGKYRVTSFPRLDELISFRQVALPSNVLSLLQNEVGFHFISYGSSLSLDLFSTILGAELDSRCNENLLNAVADLEDYMQEGVPSTFEFLKKFLLTWDGIEYERSICRLISWVPFTSFKDLYRNILVHIANYCRTSGSPRGQSRILFSLCNLLANVLLLKEKSEQRRYIAFPQSNTWRTDPKTTIDHISTFIQSLIYGVMLNSQLSPQSLHMAIRCYDKISRLTHEFGVSTYIAVPNPIVYACLFQKNVSLVNEVCKLLHRYRVSTIPHFNSSDVSEGNLGEISRVETLIDDVCELLIPGKCSSAVPNFVKEVNITDEQFEEKLRSVVPTIATTLNVDQHFAIDGFLCYLCSEGAVNVKQGPAKLLERFLNGIYSFLSEFCPAK